MNMNALASKSLQLPLLIAGLAAILCSALAFSPLMAFIQVPVESFKRSVAPSERPEVPSAIEAPAQGLRTTRAKARCAECGVIESTREIETRNEETGAGAPNRTPAGGEAEKMPTRIYETVVRLQDGSLHVINDVNPERWRPGERVTLIDGTQ